MTAVLIGVGVLGGLGLVLGLLLTVANKVFEIPSDPKRDAVRNALPGANCGGCGFAGCDALAVAIGTAHGKYPEGYVPQLDFDRLKELKDALKMPLVLHGGSGSGEENLKKAVAGGINKINVCTDAFQAGKEGMLALLEENPKADFLALQMAAEASIKKFVKDYMHIIGSNGRYTYAEYESGSKE